MVSIVRWHDSPLRPTTNPLSGLSAAAFKR